MTPVFGWSRVVYLTPYEVHYYSGLTSFFCETQTKQYLLIAEGFA